MRVAFLNRGRVHPGGDLVALDATMEALRRHGVECVETGWDRAAMAAGNFDLAHIYHCDFDWSRGNYEAVRDVGIPYVVTPIYYGFDKSYSSLVLQDAKFILPFSHVEADMIFATRVSYPKRVRVIPNGTDQIFHENHDADYMRYKQVLTVSARGKSDKNVDVVERICKRIFCKFVFATGLSQYELANLYQSSQIFVNASGSERMSLTTGEALCAGCRVLDTNANWGGEHYPGLIRFDPNDELRLERLLRWALTGDSWDYRPNEFARTLTWDYHAECLERVYQEVISA